MQGAHHSEQQMEKNRLRRFKLETQVDNDREGEKVINMAQRRLEDRVVKERRHEQDQPQTGL